MTSLCLASIYIILPHTRIPTRISAGLRDTTGWTILANGRATSVTPVNRLRATTGSASGAILVSAAYRPGSLRTHRRYSVDE
jgi:hypothetical protein